MGEKNYTNEWAANSLQPPLSINRSPVGWHQWQFWQLGWQGWWLTRHLQPLDVSPRPCEEQNKPNFNLPFSSDIRFKCWKGGVLHLDPSALAWSPSRFPSCTSNSRANHTHPSSGRWCHNVDISWLLRSVAGSTMTVWSQRQTATQWPSSTIFFW